MSFDRAFEIVVGVEGKLSMDPRDRGNWTTGVCGQGELKGTKYGISAMSYPQLDIANLTLDQAKAIYRRDYWNEVEGDSLPWPLAMFVFDSAVNQGVGAAIRLLQRSLGLTEDGIIGVQTRLAAQKAGDFQAARFMALRIRRYMGTAGFDINGDGWITRCFDVTLKAARNG